MADESSFLSRWSQRKARVRQGGEVPAEPPVSTQATLPAPGAAAAEAPGVMTAPPVATPDRPAEVETPAAPTLADVAGLDPLDPQADFTRFVGPGVDSGVKNAALKKLFTDPHFNVMDGLDVYIDDYGQPDPLPAGMLRQMAQSQFLGLFTDEKKNAGADAGDAAVCVAPAVADHSPAGEPEAPPPRATPPHKVDPEAAGDCPTIEDHENADLRLQPHDDAGRASAGPHAGPDPGRER